MENVPRSGLIAAQLGDKIWACLDVPRFGQGLVAAEPGSSLETASSIGLIASTGERLRGLAEHRSGLFVVALGFAEVPSGFPYGTGPQATLPHPRDAPRFCDERSRPIQLTGAGTRGGRTGQVSHGARLARMHLGQFSFGHAQNGHGSFRIAGRLDHRAEHSHQQMRGEI